MQGWQCGKGMIYFRPRKGEQGSMNGKKRKKKRLMDTGKWGFRAGSVPDWMSRWMDRGKERKKESCLTLLLEAI